MSVNYILRSDGRKVWVKLGKCSICGKKGELEFKDPDAVVEYGESKLCQSCQDEAFKED